MKGYQSTINRLTDLESIRKIAEEHRWIIRWDLEELVLRRNKVVLVTDSRLAICYSSSNLTEMNGYHPEEIIGKRPSMFQGPETSETTRAVIRKAIEDVKPFHVSMVNYRKNGSLYECDIEGFPVLNSDHKHAHYIAFEEVTNYD